MGEIALFDKKPFELLCRSGNLVAFSSFRDIVGLKVAKKSDNKLRKKDDVVLIEKEEIFTLFEKMR